MALLRFKCHKGEAPKYLCDLLSIDERTGMARSLRSYQEDVITYRIPFTKSKMFVDRSFSVAGPRIWNGLPVDLKHSGTVDSFKAKLKTYLFCKCYNDCNYCNLYFIGAHFIICTVPWISLA